MNREDADVDPLLPWVVRAEDDDEDASAALDDDLREIIISV